MAGMASTSISFAILALYVALASGQSCTTLSTSGWSGQSSPQSQTAPSLAFDGSTATRWTSGAAQVPGQWFSVDLGSAKTFSRIVLDNALEPGDEPRGYQVSVDSKVVATGAGDSSGKTTIDFSAVTGRVINITQTGTVSPNWWSLDELSVSNCGSGPTTTTTTGCVSTVETPLSKTGWTAQGWTGGNSQTPASQAIDGDLGTRWTSAAAQAPGVWFAVDLGSTKQFNQIQLNSGGDVGDYPRSFQVAVDGKVVATANGDASGVTTTKFTSVSGRLVNITLTAAADPSWLSIAEVNVYAPSCSTSSIPTATATSTSTTLPSTSCLPSTVPASDSWKRAQAIVAQMTQDEKITYVHGIGPINGPCVGNVAGIPRLNLPPICLQDGPSGIGDGVPDITAFPAPIVLAQTWNVDLAQQFGVAVGEEMNSKGFNVWLGPMMNIARHPYHGRIFEGSGEDPYIAAQMTYSQVIGVQSKNVVATIKHFLDNEQEVNRGGASSEVDIRTQHEVYTFPFKWGVKAKAAAAMCSYNRINGVYGCETPLINSVLKQEYGFTGFMMTDWAANMDTVKSSLNGVDMEMPFGGTFGQPLKDAIAAGKVPQCRLDDMVTRVVSGLIQVGNFDHQIAPNVNANATSAAHTQLARQISTEGHVLLKNTGNILPLNINTVKSVAIIGTGSRNLPNYSGAGSGGVSGPNIVSAWDGMVKRIGTKSITLNYGEGDTYQGVAIPAQYLTTPSGQPGIQVTYFNNTNSNGTVLTTQVQSTFGWEWTTTGPAPGVPVCFWSAIYETVFTAPESGEFMFWYQYDDGARIYWDGTKIVDDYVSDYGRNGYHIVTMNKGDKHTLKIEYYNNCGAGYLYVNWIPPSYNLWASAQAAAKASDVAFVFVPAATGETLDKKSLELVRDPRQLHGILNSMVKAIAAVNPNTIVVLDVASPYDLPWLDSVKGVILQGFGGLESGNAFASLVFGDVSFSGKNTQTWAKKASDYYVQLNSAEYPGIFDPTVGYERVQYSEGLYVGYKHFDQANIQPLYEFGYGLSYTTFAYSNLAVSPASIGAAGTVTVTVSVKNSGSVTGAEIAQLYLGFPAAANEPPKVLRGFKKATITAGQSAQYTFTLDTDLLSYYDTASSSWKVAPGTYQVYIGASSRDIRLTGSFTVTGAAAAVVNAAVIANVNANVTTSVRPTSSVIKPTTTKVATAPSKTPTGKARLARSADY